MSGSSIHDKYDSQQLLKAYNTRPIPWRFLIVMVMLLGVFFSIPIRANALHDAVPGQLIVTLKANEGRAQLASDPLSALNMLYGAKEERVLTWTRSGSSIQSNPETVKVVQLDESAPMEEALAAYEALEAVAHVEPNYYVYAASRPNDPLFTIQHYLNTHDYHNVLDWRTSSDIVVAVLDTGIDYTHEDLQSSILVNDAEIINGIDDDGNGYVDDRYGYNFFRAYFGQYHANVSDEQGHGTHIAGIIAAQSNNGVGIAGVNNSVTLLNVRFLDNRGRGSQLDAALAIRYAVDRGADVINCSWGYAKYIRALRDAIQYAHDHGVIVVAAAGNSGINEKEYPASFSDVISVSSVGLSLQQSYFSNYGSSIDFAAGGEDVYSTLPGNRYGSKSGTSQSTAFVSGLVAHVLTLKNVSGHDDVYQTLVQSTLDIDASGRDDNTGYGYILPDKLLGQIASDTESIRSSMVSDEIQELLDGVVHTSAETFVLNAGSDSALSVTDVLNFPNPVKRSGTEFGLQVNKSGEATVRIYDLAGRKVKTLHQSVSNSYNTIAWDSTDTAGRQCPNGTYVYVVEVTSGDEDVLKKGLLSIVR